MTREWSWAETICNLERIQATLSDGVACAPDDIVSELDELLGDARYVLGRARRYAQHPSKPEGR